MKKATMLVSIASTSWSYYPGQEVILTDDLAAAWELCGHAKITGEASEESEQTHHDIPEAAEPDQESETKPEAAEPAQESETETDGDKDEPESDNAAGDGTVKSGRGKKKSEN